MSTDKRDEKGINYTQYKSSISSKRLSLISSINTVGNIKKMEQQEEKKKSQKLIISLKNKRRESVAME